MVDFLKNLKERNMGLVPVSELNKNFRVYLKNLVQCESLKRHLD